MQIFLKETEGSYEHSMLVGTEPFSVADVRLQAVPSLPVSAHNYYTVTATQHCDLKLRLEALFSEGSTCVIS